MGIFTKLFGGKTQAEEQQIADQSAAKAAADAAERARAAALAAAPQTEDQATILKRKMALGRDPLARAGTALTALGGDADQSYRRTTLG